MGGFGGDTLFSKALWTGHPKARDLVEITHITVLNPMDLKRNVIFVDFQIVPGHSGEASRLVDELRSQRLSQGFPASDYAETVCHLRKEPYKKTELAKTETGFEWRYCE